MITLTTRLSSIARSSEPDTGSPMLGILLALGLCVPLWTLIIWFILKVRS